LTKTASTVSNTKITKIIPAAKNIPDVLKERPQWVNWCLEEREGKTTKIPYTPGTVRRASSTDPTTWRTFSEALTAYEAGEPPYDGIGFVFSSEDPFAGVDLDDCRDPETGELEEWAAEIVQELGGYTEVSPSGTGVHVIVRGKAPNKKRGRVEAYSSQRYFAVTGQVL
jgi:putative DNA primase/helicase